MGFAKMNVWIRKINCQIINGSFHIHVYDCHSKEVIPSTYCSNGHAEIQIPPGCYIVQAGMYNPSHSNIYTDRAVVIVRCGEEACVNLVLPNFKAEKPELVVQPLELHYCLGTFIPALVYNARKEKIDDKDLKMAVDVIAKAAKMDRDKIFDAVKADIKISEEGIAKIKGEELEEATIYLNHLKIFTQ